MSDPRTGPDEDMSRQPSSAWPDPHLRGELETTSAASSPVRHGKGARNEALAGFDSNYPKRNDRAVKAAPTGGLRPALTALVDRANRRGGWWRAPSSRNERRLRRRKAQVELLFEERRA